MFILFAEHRRSEIIFLKTGEGINLCPHLSPSPRTRTRKNREIFRCDEFLIKGAAVIGKRLSTRPIRRVEEVSDAVAIKAEEEIPQAPCLASSSQNWSMPQMAW